MCQLVYHVYRLDREDVSFQRLFQKLTAVQDRKWSGARSQGARHRLKNLLVLLARGRGRGRVGPHLVVGGGGAHVYGDLPVRFIVYDKRTFDKRSF